VPSERHAQLVERLAELSAENAELIAYIKAMQASTRWRLTAPMRSTARWLGIVRLKPRDQQHAQQEGQADVRRVRGKGPGMTDGRMR
jgi:hypothetical protein